MQLLIVSADDAKKLQDLAELEHRRAVVRTQSLEAARERFLRVSREVDAAVQLLDEALINLEEDEFDDWETARAKAEKFERIEREVDRTIAAWEIALIRCGWEIKEAQRSL